MVYFCHKWVCMFSIWREALGTYVPRLLTKCFSTFGKFGDWSWGLCYLFCSGPTDYSRLSQQCLMWDVAAQDKWYQWEGYVVWKLFGSHNSLSTAKDLCLAYTRNSRLVFCYWRWLAEKINLSWGTHLRPRRNHWSLRSQRSHDWLLLLWQKCCSWKFSPTQVLSSWNMFNFM